MPRPVDRWRTIAAAALAWILVVAAGGCGKGTTTGPGDYPVIPFQYLPRSTPQNVLQNLVSSYTRRDSVETAAIYDNDYEGTSTAPSSPTPVSNFTRADEIRHVAVLKRSSNIVGVLVDLGPPASWQRLSANSSDPAEWAVIPISASTIRIDDIGTATTFEVRNQSMEFTFKPTVVAPGDTTWTVVRWMEIAN